MITPEVAMNMNVIDLEGIDLGRVNLSDYKTVKSSAVGTISEDVINAFADLGYTVDGSNVKDMITEYQLDHQVITSKDDAGAGTFGPKTRQSLATEHGKFSDIQDVQLKIIEENKKLLISEHSLWEQKTKLVETRISAIGSPKR